MRIAIGAESWTCHSAVCKRFGECKFIILYDTETLQYHAISNRAPYGQKNPTVDTAQRVLTARAHVVLTGEIDTDALLLLTMFGIDVYTRAAGTAAEAVASYLAGNLTPVTATASGAGVTPGGT
jgi:predicted Fe-Mo cluster-binding NifX family protein